MARQQSAMFMPDFPRPPGASFQPSVWDRPQGFSAPPSARAEVAHAPTPEAVSYPLGVARGQVKNTYIVAEAEDGLVIVDQHAAHERLVLERMRRAMADGGVSAQALLLPEVVDLDEAACERREARAESGRASGRARVCTSVSISGGA